MVIPTELRDGVTQKAERLVTRSGYVAAAVLNAQIGKRAATNAENLDPPNGGIPALFHRPTPWRVTQSCGLSAIQNRNFALLGPRGGACLERSYFGLLMRFGLLAKLSEKLLKFLTAFGVSAAL